MTLALRRKRRLALAVFLVALLVLPVMLLNSQTFLLSALSFAMRNFTDFQLEMHNPQLNLFTGAVSATTLQLFPKSGGPALVSASELEGHIDIMDVFWQDLSNTRILAENVQVYLSERDINDNPDPLEWLEYLAWLPQHLQLSQLHLILEAEDTWVYQVKNVSGERNMNVSYLLYATSDFNNQPLALKLELLTQLSKERLVGLSLLGEILATETGGRVSFDGYLEGDEDAFAYHLNLDSVLPELRRVTEYFEQGLQLDGSIRVTGTMEGSTTGFKISEVNILLDNLPAYSFETKGKLQYAFSGESELDLTTKGEINFLESPVNGIDIDFSALGAARASAKITGSMNQAVIENLVLRTANKDGLVVDLSGNLMLGTNNSYLAGPQSKVRFDIHAPSLQVLEKWLPVIPYDPGPWRATGFLTDQGETLGVSDIVAEMGTDESLQLHVEGDIAEIVKTDFPSPSSFQGIDLSMRASTQHITSLAKLIEVDIPNIQLARGYWLLTGSADLLNVGEGTITISDKGLEARLSNLTAKIILSNDMPFSNLSAGMDIQISDSSVLSPYFGREIPGLGPIELSGTLKQSNDKFAFDDLQGHLGSGNGFEIFVEGEVGNLMSLPTASMLGRFSGMDIRSVLESKLEGFDYEGYLGGIGGSFLLEANGEQWRVAKLNLASEADSAFQISLSGNIDDLLNFPKSRLESKLSIEDSKLLFAFTGLRMEPLTMSASITTAPHRADIKLKGLVGETELITTAQLSLTGGVVDELKLSLTSPHAYLNNFDLQARQEDTGERYSPVDKIGEASSLETLERILNLAPPFPADVEIAIGRLSGEALNVEGVDMHLSVSENLHILRRFSMSYENTTAELRGIIDLDVTPPAFSIAGDFRALNMNHVIADLGINSDIEGTLSFRGGLTARGTRSEELLASLEGNIALALENAEIKGAAYDVLATDFLAWIYSGAATESSTHIECTRAHFQLEDGEAVSDDLYMETRRVLASGDGRLDLVDGTLDLSITPKSKTRIGQIPSSIYLTGDITDPQVSVSAISAWANIYSEYLLIVPNFFTRIFGRNREPDRETCLIGFFP